MKQIAGRKVGQMLGVVLTALALASCAHMPRCYKVAEADAAELKTPGVFASSMVLQRHAPIPVWGWATPGDTVTIEMAGQTARARVDAKGKWMAQLPAMEAGGPFEMVVRRGEDKIVYRDVLIGEVWVCSGQSNMQWTLNPGHGIMDNDKERSAADYPDLRLFQLDRRTSGVPLQDAQVSLSWTACTPQTVENFSAVGYLYGRELHKELNVPVGLIDTSWGGSRVEPWTPPEGFAAVEALGNIGKQIAQANAEYVKACLPALKELESWLPRAKAALKAGEPAPARPDWPNHAMNANNTQPTSIYNAMIEPLVPYAIRGAIWYQGESNNGEGMLYCEKMKALIRGWRQVWGQGDFPFYFVQLAPFRYGEALAPYGLPGIWEAQAATLAEPNTGMAVTVDIGDVTNIHPTNKQDVAKRLALWALSKDYGRDYLVYSGPLYKSMKVEGNAIRLSFEHVGDGLASRDGGALNWFQIAGADKNFVDAAAKIDGETLVVSSDKIAQPVAVRFAWNQEAQPNLMNKQGLPASPFRTDAW